MDNFVKKFMSKWERTSDKMMNLLKNNKVEEFSEQLEELCNAYDSYKDMEWQHYHLDEDIKHIPIENPFLPVPRIELRWRSKKYKSSFGSEGAVCDLGIVTRFGKELRFDVLSSTQTSNMEGPKELYIPSRKDSEIQALMYQLNLKAFVSFKDNYKEIKFPESLLNLYNGVKDIMSQEDIEKLKKD